MNTYVVTSPEQVRKRLLKLIEDCVSFSWAAAWATENEVMDAAINAKKKIKYFVLGTHRYITDTKVLDDCLPIKAVKVMFPEGKLFHPKVYAFDLGDTIEVYVGSSNLTGAGLHSNIECGVFINDDKTNASLLELQGYVEKQWERAEVLNKDFIKSYKANKQRVKDAEKQLGIFTRIKKSDYQSTSIKRPSSQDVSWDKFVKLVKADPSGELNHRIDLLAEAKRLFALEAPFAGFEENDRRRVAGLLDQPKKGSFNWGAFGRMKANGRYNDVVRNCYKIVSKALDQIPSVGAVDEDDYNAYVTIFLTIPTAKKTWLGMGTRLLAMKRPDQFVCLDAANREGVCESVGAAYSTLNLENYWERIIAQVRLSPWWQSKVPKSKIDRAIWSGRVAFLDSIYYEER